LSGRFWVFQARGEREFRNKEPCIGSSDLSVIQKKKKKKRVLALWKGQHPRSGAESGKKLGEGGGGVGCRTNWSANVESTQREKTAREGAKDRISPAKWLIGDFPKKVWVRRRKVGGGPSGQCAALETWLWN